MPLKVSPHFEWVLAWDMVSLIGERKSNDRTGVKVIAWGMTAQGRKETNSATYQFMTL